MTNEAKVIKFGDAQVDVEESKANVLRKELRALKTKNRESREAGQKAEDALEAQIARANAVVIAGFARRTLEFAGLLAPSQIKFLEDIAAEDWDRIDFGKGLEVVEAVAEHLGGKHKVEAYHRYNSIVHFTWRTLNYAERIRPSDRSRAERFMKIWLRIASVFGEPTTQFETDLARYAREQLEERERETAELLKSFERKQP
jgi:hypothetical protein